MYNRVKSFNTLVEIVVAFKANETKFIELQKQQWKEGLRKDETPIGQYALEFYSIMKANMNSSPGFGFMDLILTGETIGSLTVSFKRDGGVVFRLRSDRHKLVEKYGDDILGLTKRNQISITSDYVLPELMRAFREKTGMQ